MKKQINFLQTSYNFNYYFLKKFIKNSKITKELQEILQNFLWFEETQNLYENKTDYINICNKLEELQINYLEDQLNIFKQSNEIKYNHKDFYIKNRKLLNEILKFIVNSPSINENKIKMGVLEKLINKGKELNFRENQIQMVKYNLIFI